jgi:hypothetical protein
VWERLMIETLKYESTTYICFYSNPTALVRLTYPQRWTD